MQVLQVDIIFEGGRVVEARSHTFIIGKGKQKWDLEMIQWQKGEKGERGLTLLISEYSIFFSCLTLVCMPLHPFLLLISAVN